MRALTGAFVGLTAAAGVWVAVVGWRGVTVRERRPRRSEQVAWRSLLTRGAVMVAAFVVVWVLTGWVGAGVAAAGLAFIVPLLVGVRERRAAQMARSDALAAWAEMLRDTISSGAGLQDAVAVTAKVAPLAIRPQVQALAARAERSSLANAFRRFAADVTDPVADLIVAALVIADERQARNLGSLLAGIAQAAREQAAMRVRVETGRARTYASSRALVVITLALASGLILFSPEFMEPYDSFGGQVVLVLIGGLFSGALWGLVVLGRPTVPPRLLAGAEVEGRSS